MLLKKTSFSKFNLLLPRQEGYDPKEANDAAGTKFFHDRWGREYSILLAECAFAIRVRIARPGQ